MTEPTPPEHDESTMQELIARELKRLSNSPAEVIQKYIVLAVLLLFGAFVWFAWQNNARQPERLYTLLEQSIQQQGESLKIQQDSLAKLQEFAIRVPIEHAEQNTKLSAMSTDVGRLCDESRRINEAVLANTEAIGRLIAALEASTKRDEGT